MLTGFRWLSLAVLLLSPGLAASSEICAQRSKVVGGWQASLANWPAFAELRLRARDEAVGQHHCGGTIIAPEWVLTAGHCVFDVTEPSRPLEIKRGADGRFEDVQSGYVLQVVTGIDDLAAAGPENIFEVADVIHHEDYHGVPSRDGNDIALIRLAKPWTGPVARLSLSPETDPQNEKVLSLAGFGDTVEGGPISQNKSFQNREPITFYSSSQKLQETSVPVVAPELCSSTYKTAKIGEGQLCAGYDRGEQDSCQGDSGGPISARDKDGCLYQVGAVSWGEGCARKKRYGVYTRISNYAGWLTAHAGKLVAISKDDQPEPDEEKKALVESIIQQLQREVGDNISAVELSADHAQPFKLNSGYKFTLNSPISGRLILIDIDAGYTVTQIFPNSFEKNPEKISAVEAGKPVIIPPRESGTAEFQAVEPTGPGKLLALIVPPQFPLKITAASDEVLQGTRGFRPVAKPVNYLTNILDQVLEEYRKSKMAGDTSGWGFGRFDYVIDK
jgi:secreted trypsin-like serine protease